MAHNIKLNDTQLVLLSTAARREDRMVLPLARNLAPDDPSTRKALQGLIRRKLIEEVEVPIDTPAWRRRDDDRTLGLAITPAGLQALGLGNIAEDNAAPTERNPDKKPRAAPGKSKLAKAPKKIKAARVAASRNAKHATTAPKTKAEVVVTLLQRRSGASLAEMMDATGWQAHSVRGFLSGTVRKRMGLTLTSDKRDGAERCYRIGGKP